MPRPSLPFQLATHQHSHAIEMLEAPPGVSGPSHSPVTLPVALLGHALGICLSQARVTPVALAQRLMEDWVDSTLELEACLQSAGRGWKTFCCL